MKTCIFIPDYGGVSFTDLILDGKKKGETRSLNVHLPIGKWLGIAKNKKVVGEVKFGNPITIDRKSAEYADCFIAETKYDIQKGKTKLYYPILGIRDKRNNPESVVRFGVMYGKY